MLRWILYNFIFALAPLFIVSISFLWSPKEFSLYSLFSHGEPFIVSSVLSAELMGKVVSSSSGNKSLRLFTGFSSLSLFAFCSISYVYIIFSNGAITLENLNFVSIFVLALTFVVGLLIYYSLED